MLPSTSDQLVVIELNDRVFRLNKNQQLNLIKDASLDMVISRTAIQVEGCVPIFKIHEEDDFSVKNFKMPDQYVRYNGREAETDTEQVEYDLDREDMAWLSLANDRRKHRKEKIITEGVLEKAMDRLEKESHFQLSKYGSDMHSNQQYPSVDNDAACCICNDAEDSNVNQIIFCDMCNIAVHQECYGVPYIPEGQWLCRRCQLSPSVPVKCVLCPYTSGAFKQTSEGAWAHVICVLWLNEVHFANSVFLEPIEGVEFTLKRRCKLRCLVCKQAKNGACLQCSKKSCTRSFHVTCAYFSGMHMSIKQEKKEKTDSVVVNRFVYCHEHTPLSAKPATASMASWKRKVDEQIKRARKQMQTSTKDTPQVSIPVIPPEKVNEIKEELKLDKMEDVCYYWALKRRSRCGVPLIRRLQVYHSQKSLGRRSNDFGSSTDIGGQLELPPENVWASRLRNNLERVRLLCELVKKREKFKKEFLCATEMIFEACMKPVSEIMKQTLDKLVQKDHHNVFTQPVTEEEVPGYKNVIQHPMDFQTMYSRLAKGDYKKIADLKADFNLIMDNCAKFNRENKHFLTYGHRIRRIGLIVIKAAEREEAALNSSNWLFDYARNLSLLDEKDLARMSDHITPSTIENIYPLPSIKAPRTPPVIDPQSPGRVSKMESSDYAPTPNSVKKLSSPSRKRKTRISDFFNASLQTPKTTPSVNSALLSASTNYRQSRSTQKRILGYLTEASSASDTGGTSMDELEDNKRPLLPKIAKMEKRRRIVPARLNYNEFDSSDSNYFAHNDIVWAKLDNGLQMPARVVDLRMRVILESEFPVDKALQTKPAGDHHLLVVLFDLQGSWKWLSTNRLKPCDLIMNCKEGGPLKSPIQVGEALRRAKDYWQTILQSC